MFGTSYNGRTEQGNKAAAITSATPPTSPDSPDPYEDQEHRTVRTLESTDLKEHFKNNVVPFKTTASSLDPPAPVASSNETAPSATSYLDVCGVASLFSASAPAPPPPKNYEWGLPPVDSDNEGEDVYSGGPTPEQVLQLGSGKNQTEDYEMILHSKKERQSLGIAPRSASLDEEESFPRSPYFSTQAAPQGVVQVDEVDMDNEETTKRGRFGLIPKRSKKQTNAEKKKRGFKKLFGFGKKKSSSSVPPPPPYAPPPPTDEERIRVPRRPVQYDPQLQSVCESEIQGSQAERLPYSLYDGVKPRNLEPLYPYPPKDVEYDHQLRQVAENEVHGSKAEREMRLHHRLIKQYRSRRGIQNKSHSSSEVMAREVEGQGYETFRVAVPGEGTYLNDDDLIGEVDEHSESVRLNKYHGLNDRERSFLQAMDDIENEPDYIKKALTWNENYEDEQAIYRQNSAPGMMLTKSFSYDETKRKKTWRTAIDEETGREYYYNRLTRQSTWTKPPEDDLLPPKQYPVREVEEEKKEEDVDSDEESDGPLRKKYPCDFNTDVWEKKVEIYELLMKMSPPSGTSVKRLIKQFEGKEDELLEQLRAMSDEKPFDEMDFEGPLNVKSFDEGRSVKSSSRTVFSGKTGVSMLSEVTPQIRNGHVLASKRGGIQQIRENDSDGASISSEEGAAIPKAPTSDAVDRPIPRRIVPRTRELVVEDLSQDRYFTQVYDKRNDGTEETPKVTTRSERLRASLPIVNHPDPVEEEELGAKTPEQSDFDEEDATTPIANSRRPPLSKPSPTTRPTGYASMSSLTDTDIETTARKIRIEQTKKRALNQALAEEDWDRAQRLSMELAKSSPFMPTRLLPAVVTTRDLDRYVSDSDWNAVHAACGKLKGRAAQEDSAPLRKPNNHRRLPSEGEFDLHPVSVPHRSPRRPLDPSPPRPSVKKGDDNASESSYESDSDNSYSVFSSDSGSYSSDDQIRSAVRKNGPRREFAC